MQVGAATVPAGETPRPQNVRVQRSAGIGQSRTNPGSQRPAPTTPEVGTHSSCPMHGFPSSQSLMAPGVGLGLQA